MYVWIYLLFSENEDKATRHWLTTSLFSFSSCLINFSTAPALYNSVWNNSL